MTLLLQLVYRLTGQCLRFTPDVDLNCQVCGRMRP